MALARDHAGGSATDCAATASSSACSCSSCSNRSSPGCGKGARARKGCSPDVSLPSEIRDGSVAGVGSHERHNAGESAIEGQRKAGSRSQSPKGLARLTNAATPSMPPHSQANRALLRPSGVRAQGAVPTGTDPLALPCSGRKIATACEVQFMRPDTTARDQAGRSDNTASRACRFEVSAEQPPKYALYSAESHNSLLSNQLHPFRRNR